MKVDKMFSYEYVQGYTAALQDVLETINSCFCQV